MRNAVWSLEIERELDHRQVTIALLSPGSYASEICRAEQLRALDKGSRVLPVLAVQGADRPIYLYIRQYLDFTSEEQYAARFQELLKCIQSGETAKVWDLESGRLLKTLEGHSDRVTCVAATPDGRCAVSASKDRTLKVWDLESGRLLKTLEGHSDRVIGVAVTPDGRRAVSASSDNTLKVWDLRSGRALRTLEGHSGPVDGVARS